MNDIAIAILEHDATFNGMNLDYESHKNRPKMLIVSDFSLFYFVDRVRPVCLPINPPTSSQSVVSTKPFIIGWGTESYGGDKSPILKQVQVPVVDTKICRETFRRIGKLRSDKQISEMVVCAGIEAGQDSCHGDSGGPLLLPMHDGNSSSRFYQIGVVSWGIPCGHEEIPTVYSSTQYFGKWIQSVLD